MHADPSVARLSLVAETSEDGTLLHTLPPRHSAPEPAKHHGNEPAQPRSRPLEAERERQPLGEQEPGESQPPPEGAERQPPRQRSLPAQPVHSGSEEQVRQRQVEEYPRQRSLETEQQELRQRSLERQRRGMERQQQQALAGREAGQTLVSQPPVPRPHSEESGRRHGLPHTARRSLEARVSLDKSVISDMVDAEDFRGVSLDSAYDMPSSIPAVVRRNLDASVSPHSDRAFMMA